jgi:hypothetical protein
MPQPTLSDVHVNTPLTNISIAYIADDDVYIASKVYPDVPVQKQSDKYFVYTKEFWFRAEMQKRAPGAESAGGGWELNSDNTYFCDVWALHKDVDEQIQSNADPVINLDRDATEYLSQQYLIRRDKEWAADNFVAGKWDNDQTGVAAAPAANQFLRWDLSGSDPIGVIRAEIFSIAGQTGRRPNKLVLGAEVFQILVDHPDIVDRVKAGQTPGGPATVNEQALAALLGLKEVLVAWSVETTTVEGAATQTTTFILGKNALLVYVNPSPSILTPSGGYSFVWSGLVGSTGGMRIKRFDMPWIGAFPRVEIDAAFDHKLVAADLGRLFVTAVT